MNGFSVQNTPMKVYLEREGQPARVVAPKPVLPEVGFIALFQQ